MPAHAPLSLVPIPNASAPNAPCGRRVAIAADHRHSRLRQAQFRPDHVHDALPVAIEAVAPNAEIAAIPLQRLNLRRADFVDNRQSVAASSESNGPWWQSSGPAGGL